MYSGTIFDFDLKVPDIGKKIPLTKNYWNIKKEALFFM